MSLGVMFIDNARMRANRAEKLCPDCDSPFMPRSGNQVRCAECRKKKQHSYVKSWKSTHDPKPEYGPCPNGCMDSHNPPRPMLKALGARCCFRCEFQDERFRELSRLIAEGVERPTVSLSARLRLEVA